MTVFDPAAAPVWGRPAGAADTPTSTGLLIADTLWWLTHDDFTLRRKGTRRTRGAALAAALLAEQLLARLAVIEDAHLVVFDPPPAPEAVVALDRPPGTPPAEAVRQIRIARADGLVDRVHRAFVVAPRIDVIDAITGLAGDAEDAVAGRIAHTRPRLVRRVAPTPWSRRTRIVPRQAESVASVAGHLARVSAAGTRRWPEADVLAVALVHTFAMDRAIPSDPAALDALVRRHVSVDGHKLLAAAHRFLIRETNAA
ncbi:hypothetical protein [Saccharothrix sp.]|uniref:hypothetical protein n=1 Tax=Saccharothrix sp. TaxID=1873460 RepID=UPI0028120105|nr:hypothetical protein [Saccharothrix sp.]